ncbi:hypothetical protein BsWGS_22986 [Bradybaena similaris]
MPPSQEPMMVIQTDKVTFSSDSCLPGLHWRCEVTFSPTNVYQGYTGGARSHSHPQMFTTAAADSAGSQLRAEVVYKMRHMLICCGGGVWV